MGRDVRVYVCGVFTCKYNNSPRNCNSGVKVRM